MHACNAYDTRLDLFRWFNITFRENRMRHNAIISLKYDDGKPFRFYISAGGDQRTMRTALRLAMRGRRRQVRIDPETVAMAVLVYYCKLSIPPTLRPRERYAYSYKIDFASNIPTIYITHPSGDTTSEGLFAFVGPEPRYLPDKPENARAGKKQKRRGRPSILQTNEAIREKMQGMQTPYRIDPILGPVDKKGKPIKLN